MIFCIVVILGGRNEWMERLNASPCTQFHHRFSFLLLQPEITLVLALWNINLYVTSCHDRMFGVVRLDVFCWDAEALILCYCGSIVWFWNKHTVRFSCCFRRWSKTFSTFGALSLACFLLFFFACHYFFSLSSSILQSVRSNHIFMSPVQSVSLLCN